MRILFLTLMMSFLGQNSFGAAGGGGAAAEGGGAAARQAPAAPPTALALDYFNCPLQLKGTPLAKWKDLDLLFEQDMVLSHPSLNPEQLLASMKALQASLRLAFTHFLRANYAVNNRDKFAALRAAITADSQNMTWHQELINVSQTPDVPRQPDAENDLFLASARDALIVLNRKHFSGRIDCEAWTSKLLRSRWTTFHLHSEGVRVHREAQPRVGGDQSPKAAHMAAAVSAAHDNGRLLVRCTSRWEDEWTHKFPVSRPARADGSEDRASSTLMHRASNTIGQILWSPLQSGILLPTIMDENDEFTVDAALYWGTSGSSAFPEAVLKDPKSPHQHLGISSRSGGATAPHFKPVIDDEMEWNFRTFRTLCERSKELNEIVIFAGLREHIQGLFVEVDAAFHLPAMVERARRYDLPIFFYDPFLNSFTEVNPDNAVDVALNAS
jgi:hypothetical protein